MSIEPLYIEIANHIAEKIIRGEISNTSALSDARAWSEQSGLNHTAVEKAYEILVTAEVLSFAGTALLLHSSFRENALHYRKCKLMQREVQEQFSLFKLLQISPEELKDSYTSYLETKS